MKLAKYKETVVKCIATIFSDKEKLVQLINALHNRGNFNDFDTYAAAVIMSVVNTRNGFVVYDEIKAEFPDVCDSHLITLYKTAFKDYMGCTFSDCVK